MVPLVNLTAEQPGAVAAAVDKADPRKECIVLFTAAPPCQDFWRIGRPVPEGRRVRQQSDQLTRRPPGRLHVRERRHGTSGRSQGVGGRRSPTRHGFRLRLRLDLQAEALVVVARPGGPDRGPGLRQAVLIIRNSKALNTKH